MFTAHMYTYSRQTARLLDVHSVSMYNNNCLKAYCDMTCYPVFNVYRTRRLVKDSRLCANDLVRRRKRNYRASCLNRVVFNR